MNTKILIVFIVVLVIVLVLPIVAQVIRGGANSPQVSDAELTSLKQDAVPLLNETNLVGTGWNVKTPDIPVAVTITLQPGGQAIAQVPAAFAAMARQMIGTDTIMGTWRVQGSQVIASVVYRDKTHTVVCDIVGDRLFFENTEIRRVF